MHLIFGSIAAQYWFPDFPRKIDENTDTDIMIPLISKPFFKSTKLVEFHSNYAFDFILKYNKNNEYVDPDYLYTIKVSHAGWDIHWDKTMKDIQFFKSKGCQLIEPLYDLLIEEWNNSDHHYKKRVNLNKKNEEFFKDAVTRKYNHDDLHQVFKFYDEPLHRTIALVKDTALPSFHKWEDLSHEDKMKCALEEIYTVATERYIIGQKMPAKHSKYKAMKQLITSMTKGWFNTFLIVEFKELLYNDHDKAHWMPKLTEIINEENNQESNKETKG